MRRAAFRSAGPWDQRGDCLRPRAELGDDGPRTRDQQGADDDDGAQMTMTVSTDTWIGRSQARFVSAHCEVGARRLPEHETTL